MADIKWSAFPAVGSLATGDILVGLRSGANAQFSALTLPWSLTNGGTNASLTASNGGIFYSTATAGAILAGTATANQVLLSGSSTTPAWSTATYPATTTINQILYSSSANVIAGISAAAGGVLVSNGSSVPSMLANPSATGRVLTSVSGATPVWSTAIFPVAAGTAGTILRSNGTDWVNSTSTFADTYTINTILYNATANTVTGLAATARGVLVSNNTSVPSMLASASTTGQVLQGSTTGTPTWSTPTYPSASGTAGTILRSDGTNNAYTTATFADTYAVSTLLYAASSNAVSGLATVNSASLVTNGSGVPAWQALSAGQILVGTTSGAPAATAINSGSGILVANGSGSITVSATGGGVSWASIAGTTQAAAVNTGYIVANAGQTTITLPATAAIGDTIKVRGLGAAGWILAANTGQTIKYITATTSSGGSLTSAEQYDNIEVTCITANTTWTVAYAATTGLTVA